MNLLYFLVTMFKIDCTSSGLNVFGKCDRGGAINAKKIHTYIHSKFPTWISRFSRFSRFKNNLLNSYTSVITCNSAKIVEMKLTVQKTCFSSFSFLEVRLQIKQAEVSISDMTMSSSKHGDQTKTFFVNSR